MTIHIILVFQIFFKLASNQKNTNLSKINENSKTNISKPDENLSEPMCPICIETIASLKNAKIQIMSTACGHILCKSCYLILFKKETKSIDCPICRKSLDRNMIHDLFL